MARLLAGIGLHGTRQRLRRRCEVQAGAARAMTGHFLSQAKEAQNHPSDPPAGHPVTLPGQLPLQLLFLVGIPASQAVQDLV